MKRILVLAVLTLLLSSAASAQKAPRIVDTWPDQNALGVSISYTIRIYFSEDMDHATLNTSTIIVYGSVTGYHTGTVIYRPLRRTATFNPDTDFAAGEIVTFSVTTGVQSVLGLPLTRNSAFNFTVGGTGGSGTFGETVAETESGSAPGMIRAVDLNGDSDIDLVTRRNYPDYNVMTTWYNDGAGSFSGSNHATNDTHDGLHDIVLVDIDWDYDIDVLVEFLDWSDGQSFKLAAISNPFAATIYPSYLATTWGFNGGYAAADFDGDGDQDVLQTFYYNSPYADEIRILKNNGSGILSNTWLHEIQKTYTKACTADFNNDERIDFAVISTEDDSVAVWLNDGDAEFTLSANYYPGYHPGNLYAADLDGDGAVDIVTVNGDSDNITILFNTGTGTFGADVSYDVGNDPGELVAADLDGDGDLDLATSNSGSIDVSVLTNDGFGGFGAPRIDYPSGQTNRRPNSIAAADFDGDGDIDLATANGGYYSYHIMILFNRAQPHVVSTSPDQNELDVSNTTDISVTFDIDMDEATINTSTFKVNARMSEPLVTGSFNYDEPTKTATFDPMQALHKGDLVTVTLTGGIMSSGGVPIHGHTWSFVTEAGEGTGSFVADAEYNTGNGPVTVCGASFRSYAVPDLITANYMDNTVSVRLNSGSGNFGAVYTYAAGDGPFEISTGDFNSDSYLDFAVANHMSDNISVYINNGPMATFAAQVVYPVGDGPYSIQSADLNADGYLDLAISNFNSDDVSVLFNNGDGTFAGHVVYPVGDAPGSVYASDLDGDGDLDLVTANALSDNLSRILNNGDGTFTSPVNYAVGDSPYAICAVDLDGDGDPDLATVNRESNDVSVLLNAGNGSYPSHTEYAVGGLPRSIDFGDFDGDGDIDLVTADYGSDGFSVLLNAGSGGFTSSSFGPFGDGAYDAFPLDLDRDEDLDLAVVNLISDDLMIFINQNPVEITLLISVTGVDIPFADGPDTFAVLNFVSESLDSLTIITYPSQLPPDIPAGSRWVRRYYEIIPYPSDAVFVADIELFYIQLEFTASGLGVESLLHLFRYDDVAAVWEVQQGVLDVVSNSISCTGVTEFSNWAFTRSEWIVDDETEQLPKATALHQNYPNPFNPSTQIDYILHRDVDVRLAIYDVLGREIAVLVDKKQMAGYRTLNWNGRDTSGGQVASGVYFYQLVAGDFVQTRKMVLLR